MLREKNQEGRARKRKAGAQGALYTHLAQGRNRPRLAAFDASVAELPVWTVAPGRDLPVARQRQRVRVARNHLSVNINQRARRRKRKREKKNSLKD
jgi:hypothetical protein